MSIRTLLHETARAYAAAGIPVFPCVVGGKKPACANGFKDATCDFAQIDAWWAQDDYNVGMCPEAAGYFVVDVEAGGEAQWEELRAQYQLPETYATSTPGGGRHHWFIGSGPSKVRIFGNLIDTRGVGGYILVPPSIVDDHTYAVVSELNPQPIPLQFIDALAAPAEHHPSAIGECDLPSNVDRARTLLLGYIDRDDIALTGHGGQTRTYLLGCEVRDLAISEDRAYNLIAELWNPACRPPWDRRDLEQIIHNAYTYAQNEPGAWGVDPGEQAFRGNPHLDQVIADSLNIRGPLPRRSRFYPEDDDEMESVPEGNWLVEPVIQDQTTVMVYGPPQSFKSFVMLDLALGVATGHNTFGAMPATQGVVFYCTLEGLADVKRKRRRAWRIARGVDWKTDFHVVRAPMLFFEAEVVEFKAQLRKRLMGRPCHLLVLETVSKMLVGLDATKDAPKLLAFLDGLVEEFHCAVIVIHHTGHNASIGPRDSSAYMAGVDTAIEVSGDRRRQLCEVWVRKHKDNEEPEIPFCFRGQQVGPSLVFDPIPYQDYVKLVEEDDPYDRKRVAAALVHLNARGDLCVTHQVLARELLPQDHGEAVEAYEGRIRKAATALGRLGRRQLKDYRHLTKDGWCLP